LRLSKSLYGRGVERMGLRQTRNAKMKTRITARSQSERIGHDFEISDAKGRNIGAAVEIQILRVEETQEEDKCYYTCFDAPGEYVAVRVSPTRNGYKFGACQSQSFFKSVEAANHHAESRLAASKKRYEKQFA
jgi:hypothetical protein